MRNMKILSISSVWKKHGASTPEVPRQLIPHGTRWPRPWWHHLDASAFRLTSVTTRQGNSAPAHLGGANGGAGGSLLAMFFFFQRGGIANWKTPKVKEYISRKLSDFVSKKFRLLKFWEGQGSFLRMKLKYHRASFDSWLPATPWPWPGGSPQRSGRVGSGRRSVAMAKPNLVEREIQTSKPLTQQGDLKLSSDQWYCWCFRNPAWGW